MLGAIALQGVRLAAPTLGEGFVVIEEENARLGESWDRGIIVLAWDSVRSGTANMHDGHNVVLHEFAHQLDAEDGDMDGAPDLGARARYTAWAHVLGDEFNDLVAKAEAGRKTDIDTYGATNPAEFFAVVTETFFEKPRQLRMKHPELYEQLIAACGVTPLPDPEITTIGDWFDDARGVWAEPRS